MTNYKRISNHFCMKDISSYVFLISCTFRVLVSKKKFIDQFQLDNKLPPFIRQWL